LALPAWLKVTVQVPVPLVMVTVPPLNEQTPDVPMLTVRSELAVAATRKVVLYTAVAGAADDTVIVWSALAACTVRSTLAAAL